MTLTISALCHNLWEIRRSEDPPLSYQAIGDIYKVNKTVIWRIMNTDYEPMDPVIRARLGLPTSATIHCLDGVEIPQGSIVGYGAQECSCDRHFVPNVPWRKWCFYCRPIK